MTMFGGFRVVPVAPAGVRQAIVNALRANPTTIMVDKVVENFVSVYKLQYPLGLHENGFNTSDLESTVADALWELSLQNYLRPTADNGIYAVTGTGKLFFSRRCNSGEDLASVVLTNTQGRAGIRNLR